MKLQLQLLLSIGVARNFGWEGPKVDNFVTFFGDVVVMTSLK